MSYATLTVKLDNRLYDRLLELARKREQEPGALATRAVVDYLRSQDALAATLLENEVDLDRWGDESPAGAASPVLQLELNATEQETLAEVLRSFLSELRNEVSHTDRQAYRERLKAQELLIKQIQERLDRP